MTSRPQLVIVRVFLCFGFLAGGAARAAQWTATWASSQQIVEDRSQLAREDLTDATLRQNVRVSIGGPRIRVRVSNVFGSAPLTLGGVHVAKAVSPANAGIDPTTDRRVTFDGRADITIPAGADYLSDPVDLPVAPLTTLAVSLRYIEAPERQSGHPGSRATSYVAKGDRLGASDLPGAKRVDHWYNLSAIEVEAPRAAAIVTLGDSITDGHGATTNGNDRWPDILANRLAANPATRHVAVLNHGIGGNRLLLDGIGPNALARIDRDVIAQSGARFVIVLEGVNDLGSLTRERPAPAEAHRALVARIIGSYAQLIERARAHGIKAIGATILPFGGSGYYHPDAANEADRQAINRWIRQPGNFDAVLDFDAVVRDPARPDRLRPAYDIGDGLHPSPAGYRAMGEAISLSLFRK